MLALQMHKLSSTGFLPAGIISSVGFIHFPLRQMRSRQFSPDKSPTTPIAKHPVRTFWHFDLAEIARNQ
eukprot:scaffold77838_cov17-Prasinocladus_malaysianus.AAC.1